MLLSAKRIVVCVFFSCLIFISCDSSDGVRQYTEDSPPVDISRDAGEKHAAAPAQQPDPLTWDTPAEWVEERKSSTMRLAAFSVRQDDKEAICTIIPLKGDGGGLKANVRRWLAQLDIRLKSEAELDQFIARQKRLTTSGGLPAVLVDFTGLQPAGDTSILVGIVTLKGATVFIKMTGDTALLSGQKDRFLSLIESLKIGS